MEAVKRLTAHEAMEKFKYQFEPFVYIHNRKNFLLGQIPELHPDGTEYLVYWKEVVRECIEGRWAVDGPGYRWMPGNLFFYVNLGTILHKPEDAPKTAPRQKIRPYLRDVEWEFFYNWIECRGFSGFEDDEEYTCNKDVLKYEQGKLSEFDFDKLNLYAFKRNGELKKYIPAREYLRKLHDKPLGLALFDNEAQNMFMLGCLQGDEQVRMFDGSLKASRDIVVGDELMGIDSTKRTVRELIRGSQMMYEVSSEYGEPFTCTGSHILHLLYKERKTVEGKRVTNWVPKDIQLLEYLELSDKEKEKYQARISDTIEYAEKELIWNPYFLGLWLGDGFSGSKMICINRQKDKEIFDWLISYVGSNPERFSYTIKDGKSCKQGEDVIRFYIKDKELNSNNNWFCNTLKNNKHIPEEFTKSSAKQRYELLAGMIDSDGSLHECKTQYTISNSNYQLLLQFQEIARSLGIITKLNKLKNRGGFATTDSSDCYQLRLMGENILNIPCKVDRKIKGRKRSKYLCGHKRNKISIRSTKVESFYGFEIDQDHLFLLEDYTITHNARGFGKSYMVSVGIVLFEWLFDGRKYYNRVPELYGGDASKNKVEIFVGAAQASKSADLLSKFKDAYDELPGGWGQGEEYVPPPYFKSATGSLTPAAPKPWKHEYLVKEAGNWVPKGSGSTIKHGVYTTENPEAAAGTRPAVMVIEEVGLLPNALTVHNSNEACVLVSGTRIGSCMYLGTGGNMEKIRESEIMFRDPGTYSFLSFPDVYEGKGQIGWFVPAFYNLDKFKDENGNTMYEHAIPFYLDRRKEKRKGKSGQHAIDLELMNFPMVPSEMFLRKHGNILPIDELRRRLAQLEANDLFEQIEKPVSLYFDSTKKYGISYDIITDHSRKPINKFPTPTNTDPEGCPVIYEFPLEKDGEVPKDMYIIGHDPYASDDSENGSYASIYVFKTGKYQLDGLGHNEIVAEYVGRPYAGRNKVNEILEKFAMLYNVGPGGIWFENDRGNTKEYFEKRNKLGLLCLKPMTVLSKTLTRRISGGSVQYGYSMGSKQAKLQGIEYLRDWLLEQRGEHNGVKLRNLDLLASRAFIQECIAFNMDENFDRVMGACGFVIGLRNIENELIDEAIEKKSSAGSFFGSNKGLFLDRRRNNRQDRYR